MTRDLLRWVAPFGVGVVIGVLAWLGYTIGMGPTVNPWTAGLVVFLVGRGVNAGVWLVQARETAFEK